MDVSAIVSAQQSKYKSTVVEKDIPLEIDVGLLTVTDPNPPDEDAYKANLEEYLTSTARDGVQSLVAALFALPTKSSPDGPLALLPKPTTALPRSKPLPKPKPPTKWEKFAAAKGIQHKVRDRKVFDEEKQEWVNRWGKDGKNRELEEQWLTEVPANAPADFDPAKESRDKRKERVAKNDKQRDQNLARAQGTSLSEKKKEIERASAMARVSTASMGKFDKKLEGESKIRGQKRKFDSNEMSTKTENQRALSIIAKLDGSKKRRTDRDGAPAEESVVNVRKAIRHASKGKGGVALGHKVGGGKPSGARASFGKKGKR
ncbi:RRS1-domain-containing protein [Exidia glandulosa HHB12029]|uniref:Ribosome biogenesis regulatory protein n=1 Tax=Exidia glandulosa HHB12029 TaxID=1314781 RepID=A0A165R1N9_EXIGL|nr:RRS1-domain-containing protein [Exidia glandulosa HHB12029]